MDKHVTELYIEKNGRLSLTIKINSPVKMDIFMIDINQFNMIVFNKDCFNQDKYLGGIGDNDWVLYDIELSATKLDPRDLGAGLIMSFCLTRNALTRKLKRI